MRLELFNQLLESMRQTGSVMRGNGERIAMRGSTCRT